MDRKKLTAMIHIARANAVICPKCGHIQFSETTCTTCRSAAMAMTDSEYRRYLKRITGKESARFMDDTELDKVYQFFCLAGFRPKPRNPDPIKEEHKISRKKTMGIILNLAREQLSGDWEKRLEGFIKEKTQGKTRLYQCTDTELRQIIGWLRRKKKYGKPEIHRI